MILKVELSQEEWERLLRMGMKERRTPSQQAGWLIVDGLCRYEATPLEPPPPDAPRNPIT